MQQLTMAAWDVLAVTTARPEGNRSRADVLGFAVPLMRLALMCLLALVAALPATAQAPARHALLIGNQNYTREVGTLKNPVNDVALIAGALEKIGFRRENIRRVTDADRVRILREIDAYGDRLAAAGADAIGFFYYSGHGVANERDQRNYLIPIEVKQLDSAVWYSGIPLDDIIAKLSAQAREASHFVLFDACRNVLNVPSRGPKGFVPVASRRGMLIGFSTDPGQTASDAGATSGPYATALAAELVKPGQHHLDLFQNVKEQVFKSTQFQVPWERNGLLSRVYLGGSAVTLESQPQPPLSEAAQAWSASKDTTSVAVLEAFARRYPDTVLAELARARIVELKGQQSAAARQVDKPRQDVAAGRPSPWDGTPEPPRQKTGLEALADRLGVPPISIIGTLTTCDGVKVVLSTGGTACVKPGSGNSFKDCLMCPEMLVVPAGSFMLGSPEFELARLASEGPQRRVMIAQPFAIGKFEVTFDEWDACLAARGCTHRPDDRGWGRGRRPVIDVSWDDAKQYVAWLAKSSGKSYRLPSEAEWEYSARAGTSTPFWWGSDISTAQANYSGHYAYASGVKGEDRQRTTTVDDFQPNAWGLFNVHGNVCEWVEDAWHPNHGGAPPDGSARQGDTSLRVRRDGSWNHAPVSLRSAHRSDDRPFNRNSSIGFRVARTLSESSP